MSKIEEARHATPDDLDVCRQALRRLYELGIKHGYTNKHNFLIHPHGVTMIDLDFAKHNSTEIDLNGELYDLEQQLADTSGKGGVKVVEPVDGMECSDRVEAGEQ